MFFLNPKFGNLRIISPFFTNYMGKRNIITLWSLEGVADGNEMGIASRNGNGNGNGNGNSAQTHQLLCLLRHLARIRIPIFSNYKACNKIIHNFEKP